MGDTILWMGDKPQYKSSPYAHKHSAPKNVRWDDVVKSTKNGPAKYKYGTNIEELEMEALEKGIDASNGKPWKVYNTGRIIGAKDGESTPYIRVEISADGTVHSHPITSREYKKLSK